MPLMRCCAGSLLQPSKVLLHHPMVIWVLVIAAELQQSIETNNYFSRGPTAPGRVCSCRLSRLRKQTETSKKNSGPTQGGPWLASAIASPSQLGWQLVLASADLERDGSSSSRALTTDASNQTVTLETCHDNTYQAHQTDYELLYSKINHSRDYTQIILPEQEIFLKHFAFIHPHTGFHWSALVLWHHHSQWSFSNSKSLEGLTTGTSSSLRETHQM